jgi:tetratricopeptide (TPR) repeat protein
MNPSEKVFQELKRQQKALSLTDSDTQSVNPDLAPDGQPPNQKDIDFYKKQYQDAMERQYPLLDSDRRELESLQQVLHLKYEEVLEIEQQLHMTLRSKNEGGVEIEQQLANTVLQTNETAFDSGRIPSPPPSPSFESPSENDFGLSADASNPLPDAFSQPPVNRPVNLPPVPMASEQANLSLSQEQVINQLKAKYGAGAVSASSSDDPWAQPPANANPDFPAANPEQPQTDFLQQPFEYAAAAAQPLSTVTVTVVPETPVQAAPVEVLSAEVAGLDSTPPATVAGRSKPGKVQFDRRPWLISLGLLAATLGILSGIWLAVRTYFTPAAQPNPEAAEPFFQSGTQQAKQWQNAKAIADLDQAIRLNPNDPSLYLNRGIAHYQAGDLSKALNDYNEAIRLNSNFAEAYSNRCQLFVTQQRYDDAVTDCSRAIDLNSNLIEAYLNRGNALFGKNNLDNALQDYQKAQQSQDPAIQSKAYNNTGNIYAARGQLDQAIASYDEAIKLVRTYADAFFNRALALQRKNQREEAAQGFRDAANLYRNQGNIEMSRRAEGNANRLQQGGGSAPAGSPPPEQTTST